MMTAAREERIEGFGIDEMGRRGEGRRDAEGVVK